MRDDRSSKMSLTLLQGYSSAEEEDAEERDYENSDEEDENHGVERYGSSSSSVFNFSASHAARDSCLPSANDVFSQVIITLFLRIHKISRSY